MVNSDHAIGITLYLALRRNTDETNYGAAIGIVSRLRTGQIRDEYRLIKRTVSRNALTLQPALWSE